jgi:transcriptional regulator GlxA family with amidase domain
MICVELLLFDAVDVLDVGGPYEVLLTANRLLVRDGAPELFDVQLVADTGRPSTAYGGLGLVPTAAVSDDPVDVFIVPGAVDLSGLISDPGLLQLIRRRSAAADVTASVCTGALLLAHAGLLDGVTATTHHEDVGGLAARIGPDHAITALWVDTGRIVTAGGLSAGIAMALHLVDRFATVELARRTARQIAYDWDPTDGVDIREP